MLPITFTQYINSLLKSKRKKVFKCLLILKIKKELIRLNTWDLVVVTTKEDYNKETGKVIRYCYEELLFNTNI